MIQRISKNLFAFIFLFVLWHTSKAQSNEEAYQDWQNLKAEVPRWLQDAKFGIYFHWGVYSVPAYHSEWYSRSMYVPNTAPNKHHLATYGTLKDFGYKDFIPLFTAAQFNAEAWADLFVQAGAKFAGPVAEHADGFSMWNSKINPWNAKRMGPKQDIVLEMEKAIRKRKLKFITTFHHQWLWGWYPTFDSSVDAGNPQYAGLYGPVVSEAAWQQKEEAEKPDDAFCNIWRTKVEEVIRKYKPDLLYFDSRLGHIKESYRKEVVTDYLGKAKNRNDRVILYKGKDLPADVGVRTYEKSRMNKLSEKTWLTEEPISTYSWCYTDDIQLRPAKDILNGMIDVVSKNGIYLLNICPKADGTIPQDQKDILLAIGGWLHQYGEAVYSTRPWIVYGEGPRKEAEEKNEPTTNRSKYAELKFTVDDIRYTCNGNTIYAIALGPVNEKKKILLTAFGKDAWPENIAITHITLPGSDTNIVWEQTDKGLLLHSPASITEKMATVFKIETRSK